MKKKFVVQKGSNQYIHASSRRYYVRILTNFIFMLFSNLIRHTLEIILYAITHIRYVCNTCDTRSLGRPALGFTSNFQFDFGHTQIRDFITWVCATMWVFYETGLRFRGKTQHTLLRKINKNRKLCRIYGLFIIIKYK